MKSPVPMLCQSIQVIQQIQGISSTNVVSVSPGHTTDTWNLQYQCCVSQSRSHNRYMESSVPMLYVSVNPGHTTDTWNLQYQYCVSQSRSHNRYMESSVPMLCQSIQVTQQIHGIFSTNVVSVNPGHTTDTWNLQYQCCVSQSRSYNRYINLLYHCCVSRSGSHNRSINVLYHCCLILRQSPPPPPPHTHTHTHTHMRPFALSFCQSI